MPRRMTYEELIEDTHTRRILKKYEEKGKLTLRRNELGPEKTNNMTFQRRLNRLCEDNVLRKVDREGHRTRGGKSAPETYYELMGEHMRRAIKSADIERLREQGLDRMCSGILVTIYGMDVSDFEENEEERRAFLGILQRMDSLGLALLMLKARFLQRVLKKTSAVLDKSDVDPITRWMVEYYAWMSAMAPLTGVELGEPEEFLFKAMLLAANRYGLDEAIDDDERTKISECVGKAMTLTTLEHVELGDLVKAIGGKALSGMVVTHITPLNGEAEASYDRIEDRYRRFLKLKDELKADGESLVFEWLQECIPTIEDLKSSVQPFRATLRKHLRKAPDNLKEKIRRIGQDGDLAFLVESIQTGFLEPPEMPTIDDMRKYWKRQKGDGTDLETRQ